MIIDCMNEATYDWANAHNLKCNLVNNIRSNQTCITIIHENLLHIDMHNMTI